MFTQHALKRARERKLWKYVNKEKFYFDASYAGFNTARLDDCIYAFKNLNDKTIIVTMFRKPLVQVV